VEYLPSVQVQKMQFHRARLWPDKEVFNKTWPKVTQRVMQPTYQPLHSINLFLRNSQTCTQIWPNNTSRATDLPRKNLRFSLKLRKTLRLTKSRVRLEMTVESPFKMSQNIHRANLGLPKHKALSKRDPKASTTSRTYCQSQRNFSINLTSTFNLLRTLPKWKTLCLMKSQIEFHKIAMLLWKNG